MSHLKRLRAPKAWPIKRKSQTFTTRTNPGPRKMDEAVSLNFLIRDMLSITKSTRETKKALANGGVLINNIPRKDHKFTVGILDTVTIPSMKANYIMVFSPSGKLQLHALKAPLEGKFAKIMSKTILRKKKIQLNLHDGTNMLIDRDTYHTGDTLIVDQKKIKKHLKCEKGALIYLTGGKHKGNTGTLEEVQVMNNMQKHRIMFRTGKEKFETLKEYAFVIDKPF